MTAELLPIPLPGPEPADVIAWMDASSFDELYEADVPNDRCVNLFHVDGKYHVPVLDSSYRQLFKYAIDHMVHPDDREIFDDLMNPDYALERLAAADRPGMRSAQFRYLLQNGEWRWVEQYVFCGEEFGVLKGVVRCYIFDIQNKKDRERGKSAGSYFEKEEQRDERTRLLREKGFLDTARALLQRIDDRAWCIVSIDIEHFKLFNDWYGRKIGALLLAKMGERLLLAEQELGGLAGYFGKADFYLIMRYDRDAIMTLHSDLTELVEGFTIAVGFRLAFGVAMVDLKVPLYDLLDRADLALDAARNDIKKDICVFNPGMLEQTNREHELLLEFKRAIRNREFVVYVQPQCRVSTGKIVGIEALARWRKPSGELVAPMQFIPTLEKYGFITDLDLCIWEEVCSSLRAWLDTGSEAVPVSVNVSQADIYAIDVPDCLQALVDKYDIPSSLLKVEITESTFASSTTAVQDVVRRLHEKGFVVLMDDFGSGYSSLNMLSTLNVDVIKLDADFLHMDDSGKRKSIHIVESVINMAKTMGLPIITEGVETQDQIDFLDSLGVRYIQGFYYYKPMPLEEFEALVGEGGRLDSLGFVAKLNEEMHVREFLDRNVYSDAMLNNILGAVAFYLWHGDHVDIVRFNERFYEAVGVPDFHDRLENIEQFVPQDERARFFNLLERSMGDELNGAFDTIGFYKSDGSLVRFLLRCYYVGESAEGKRFYTSAHDVTDLREAQMQMEVLSECLPISIVFIRQNDGIGNYKVVVHGLEKVLGISREQFQRELSDGSFYDRANAEAIDELKLAVFECVKEGASFACSFELTNERGDIVPLKLRADHAEGTHGGPLYVITLSELNDLKKLNHLTRLDS